MNHPIKIFRRSCTVKVLGMLLLLLPWYEAHAGLAHDSDLNWFSRESAHFIVHYHDGEAELALQTLHIAESVHQRLAPLFSWQPKTKTDLVLSDETDASNGFATPFPSNRITLFASQPSAVNSLEDHNGWLEALILHEYVHILHMDKALGGVAAWRRVFGRFPLLFPNVFMPPWMHEGLATYLETDTALGIGRGQSSYFDMMMRVEVAAGVKPVYQINQPMVTWPLLTSRYLYGVYFYQFIADTYGERVVMAVVQSYSYHAMPYRINDVYQDVLGKSLDQLWEEFTLYLQGKFSEEEGELASKVRDEGKFMTHTGDFKRSLQQHQDGRVFFISDHLQQGTKLMLMKDEKSKPTVFADVQAGARLDLHDQAGLLVAQPELCRNANTFYDLYHIDTHSSEIKRLTHCKRYIYASWSPAGDEIIAVANGRGQHGLHLLNQDGQLKKVLWQGKHGETLSQLDWSGDGNFLVTAVWREHKGWDVEEFEIATKTWRALTHDAAIETDVRYVGNARDILFSTDADAGVYNIHRLVRKTGMRYKLTDVFGGAFSPLLTNDNHLLYVGYGAQGFDVMRLASSMQRHFKQPLQTRDESEDVPVDMAVESTAAVAYAPWESLAPTYWFPLWSWTNQGSEWGISTSGNDVLSRHRYSLDMSYHTVSEQSAFQLDYIYDRWKPLLQLSVGQSQLPTYDQQGALIALFQQQRLNVALAYPFLSRSASTVVQVGLSYLSSDLAWLHADYVAAGNMRIQDAVAGVAWSWDTRQQYPRSISVSEGKLWSATFETGQGLGGDYGGNTIAAQWHAYVDLEDERVLAMRAVLGWQTNAARPYQLGGVQQGGGLATNLLQVASPFNQRRFALRGYASNNAQLSGGQMGLASLEYRFPLARVERGWMAPPLGLDQLFGVVFADVGGVSSQRVVVGSGVELGADVVLFYNLRMRVQVGYAKGFDANIGGETAYFRLGSAF